MIRALTASVGLLLGLIVLVPLLVCLVYSTGLLGSIGPWVPVWGAVTLLCAPFAVYLPVSSHLSGTWQRVLLGWVSAVLAVLAAILSANALMAISHLFGLYDYSQM
ncbi:hypothetical protein J2X06_002924 [Lysobacter niastensis]|uniref:Transmembrane protein n=1 Tax=Lysobacter niastensis TaxID=380629 RepID=A0ABU1WED6_9GAMM|nr:hypothetical protein [Lysobacter niastensis]MDR7135715.1 hypothetical protein [Lysobacter niastensis]